MAIDYNGVCDDSHPTETLADLRKYLLVRLGFAAMLASPPPGMADLLNSFLTEAQTLLYQRFRMLRMERWFSWTMVAGTRFYAIPANDEAATLATPAGVTVTTAAGGTLAAGSYAYRVSATNANGETLATTEATVTAGASGKNTITVPAVTGATGYNFYGRTAGAELLLGSSATTSFVDDGSIAPAGALPTSNTTAICPKTLDASRVRWVGISLGDNTWRQLVCGIDPARYYGSIQGIPDSYDIRQCIEVFPPPSSSTWILRIKGDFGLLPFAADTDVTTIDPQAIKLHALAYAKAHYGQPDAANHMNALTTFLGDLAASTHLTRRYIPGERIAPPAVQPKAVV